MAANPTYDTTIVYLFDRQVWRVARWGDCLDKAEREGISFD